MNKFLLIAMLLISVFASNAQGNVPTLPPQAKSHAVKFAPTPTPPVVYPSVDLGIIMLCENNMFYAVNNGDPVFNVSYTVFGENGWLWGGIIPTITKELAVMVYIPNGTPTYVFLTVSGKTTIGTC